MSRCALCDKVTKDEELKLDREGWKRFEPACKKCLLTIRPEEDSKFKPWFCSDIIDSDEEGSTGEDL